MNASPSLRRLAALLSGPGAVDRVETDDGGEAGQLARAVHRLLGRMRIRDSEERPRRDGEVRGLLAYQVFEGLL